MKPTISASRHRHRQDGNHQRPGEANLTALACTDPPEGRQRWTIRLLADKIVEIGTVDTVSPTTVYTW